MNRGDLPKFFGTSLALQMPEESLNRLQTDHLDLWQVHGMVFQNDPESFIRPNGAAESPGSSQLVAFEVLELK